MRTPSIEIKKLNLQKIEIQLQVLNQRVIEASNKLDELKQKIASKEIDAAALQRELAALTNPNPVEQAGETFGYPIRHPGKQ